MTGDSRQQRRKLIRERQKVGERVLARGLATQPGRADVVAAAEAVRAKLTERDNRRRAGEAARLAQSLAERSLRAYPPKIDIACAKGCAYCCHLMVAVMPPEAFAIADHVRGGKSAGLDVNSVLARGKPLIGVSHEARVGAKLPCPLLVEGGLCAVYDARPLNCRQTTSRSLPSCIDEFEGRDGPGGIEASSAHLAHASNAHVVLLGAMKAMALPTLAYELAAILDVILPMPDAEARWLSGEPIFATLPPSPSRPREIEFVTDRIAEELTR